MNLPFLFFPFLFFFFCFFGERVDTSHFMTDVKYLEGFFSLESQYLKIKTPQVSKYRGIVEIRYTYLAMDIAMGMVMGWGG